MTFNTVTYLSGVYWPYLLAAVLIGIIVGWRSFTPPAA